MNAIEIKNLHFSYGKENVLDGVSLCLKEGRLAILAGKRRDSDTDRAKRGRKIDAFKAFIRRAPDRGKPQRGSRRRQQRRQH